jgi:ligand-binding SRPBCC domain-containing protein
MPSFNYSFAVNASQSVVNDFHHNTSVLKTLTPPPIFIKIHNSEPLREGSIANFTLWFGPFPIRWQAVHTNVDENGFTDTQVRGPLKRWQHTHRFTALGEEVTLVNEHIEYEYRSGIWGLVGRLLFSPAALYLLFTARKLITKRQIGKTESEGTRDQNGQ